MKIVLRGCLCGNAEQEKQIVDAFEEEFGKGFKVLGTHRTLAGKGGEGGRSEVVVEMPDSVVPKAATHPWHLGGLFVWYDDYVENNGEIVPADAMEKFFGKRKEAKKPQCPLIGTDGNVFMLAGRVTAALRKAGQREKADEFGKKLHECESYDKALVLMGEYVEIC